MPNQPPAHRIAARALHLVGTPFRLHGRNPAFGLDCIGLAAEALAAGGIVVSVPTGYAMRGGALDHWDAFFRRHGFARIPETASAPGDLWLVAPGPRQAHLMIEVPGGFVHAHAGLGRAAFLPAPQLWPVIAIWRPTWRH